MEGGTWWCEWVRETSAASPPLLATTGSEAVAGGGEGAEGGAKSGNKGTRGAVCNCSTTTSSVSVAYAEGRSKSK